MSKHTPGPWFVFTESNYPNVGPHTVVGFERNGVRHKLCNLTDHDFWGAIVENGEHIESETLIANAHLIAAAPEMLEMLEMVRHILWCRGEGNEALMDGIEAAIAEAKGETDE